MEHWFPLCLWNSKDHVSKGRGEQKGGDVCGKEGWCALLSSVSAGRMQGQGWVIASPPPAVRPFLIIDTTEKKGTKYRYADDSDQESLLWHTQSHREWICLLKLIRRTPYDLWPLGPDRKRSVFHQNNKCGQGDLTFKQQRHETHTHISTIVHLWD